MDQTTERAIRERAYGLWEKEGSPEGRDHEFWERARMMVEADAAPALKTPLQQRAPEEHAADKALEETFPASDPPAMTRPSQSGRQAKSK